MVQAVERRFLIVGDLARLGPIVAEVFAGHRIDGVHTYLEGIAEIPRTSTRGILVGYDASCRKPDVALAALKSVAGDAPLIFCCEPAYETIGRRLLDHGVDDYLIFPPGPGELEVAFKTASRDTQRQWVQREAVPPIPKTEELARLAEVWPAFTARQPGAMDSMAALIACAIGSQYVIVSLDGQTGRYGNVAETADAVLVETISSENEKVGAIRVGPRNADGYSHEDTSKLKHYATLFGRMFESASRTERWRQLAMADELTGLPNRRHLLEFLEEKLKLAEQSRNTLTAFVFDIDDFKRYNDKYGHDAGDEILCEVGRLFVQCSRRTDMVARYGGDEFVVVFWDPEGPRTAGSRHPEGVIAVVQRFRQALKSHHFTRLGKDSQGALTISGGLAHYPWQARTGSELLEAADKALLAAKAAGKNRFWVVGTDGVCHAPQDEAAGGQTP
jgi:diguanylate cyclase (GGDEF)-like protein